MLKGGVFGPWAPQDSPAVRAPSSKKASPRSEAVPARRSHAKDLEPHDWAHKFEQVKLRPDGVTPARGEISRVARLVPVVPKNTLRLRFASRNMSTTKMGPEPTLGQLEEPLLEWLKCYIDISVHVYTGVVREKARKLAIAAGGDGSFVASPVWLDAFCKRHGLNIRQGQFLEKERAHAVSREGMTRWYDLLGIASKDVRPEDIWMLDEVHVNLLDTGGYTVRPRPPLDPPSATT